MIPRRALALVALLGALLGAALGCRPAAAPAPVPARGSLLLDRIPARPGGGLVAGAAVVDLTPYEAAAAGDVYVAGFMPGRTSRGTRDPITGRVLYLDDGREWVVLASLDVIGILLDEVEQLRARVATEHPERVLVAATHNHQSPDTIGFWGFGVLLPFSSGKDRAYMETLRTRVADAIGHAVTSARPARVRFGRGVVPEGISTNLWFPDEPARKDDELLAMAVDGTDGLPIATVVDYAVHAEALFEENRLLSADLPGRVYGPLERARGGGVALYFQGALGGMIVPVPNRFDERERYEELSAREAWMDEAGATIARVAFEALAGSAALGPDDLHVRHRVASLYVPIESWVFDYASRFGIVDLERRGRRDGRFRTEAHLVEVGPARMLAVPGELFPSLGRRFKERLASPYPFLLGLANDELGYVMTAEEFEDSTYGYEQSMSMGPETGPLLEAAVAELLAGSR